MRHVILRIVVAGALATGIITLYASKAGRMTARAQSKEPSAGARSSAQPQTPGPAGPQAPAAVFRGSVDRVVVAASVRDGRGRIVRNLKKTDFEVIDSGFGRPIQEFYSGNAPI